MEFSSLAKLERHFLMAVICVVASHLGAEVREWNTPTLTLWQEHIHYSNTGNFETKTLDQQMLQLWASMGCKSRMRWVNHEVLETPVNSAVGNQCGKSASRLTHSNRTFEKASEEYAKICQVMADSGVT